jgi:hypothetical protein
MDHSDILAIYDDEEEEAIAAGVAVLIRTQTPLTKDQKTYYCQKVLRIPSNIIHAGLKLSAQDHTTFQELRKHESQIISVMTPRSRDNGASRHRACNVNISFIRFFVANCDRNH